MSRTTGNIPAARQVIDMSNKIALLQPNETPFMAFMKLTKKNTETATNPEFKWLEDDIGARWDAINNGGGYTSGDTKIVVDTGATFAAGFIVKVPRTGEVFLVQQLDPDGDNANELLIVRGYGTTTAAALVDNDPLVIIGNANEEMAGRPAIKATTEQNKSNYTQIFRTPFGVSRTADNSKLYGGKDLAYQRMKKAIEHKVDMSRAFIFGEKKLDTTGEAPRRTTGGLLSFATENNYDAGGTLTKSEFDNNLSEIVFKYGSKKKILLCSARLLSVINGWAESKLQLNQGAQKFGLSILEYITPHGTFMLMNESRILEGAVYGGYGIVVDPENVKYRPLANSDTKLRTNIQHNDTDGQIDEWLTECGLEVRLPKTHGVITGVWA